MPTDLHLTFEENPELQKLNPAQRFQFTNALYNQLEASGQATRGQLRDFRDEQLESFYDQEKAEGKTRLPYADWQAKMRGGSVGIASADPLGLGLEKEQEASPEAKELFKTINDRNDKEWWKDLGDNLTEDSLHIPKALGQSALDLVGLASAAGHAGFRFAGDVLDNTLNPFQERKRTTHFLEDFGKEFAAWKSSGPAKWMDEIYQESIKNDPKMFRAIDWAIVDGAFAVASGLGAVKSLAKAGAKAGAEAAVVPTLRDSLQVFGSQIASQGATSMALWNAVGIAENAIENSDVPDEEKEGLLIASLLPLGILGGHIAGRNIGNTLASPAFSRVQQSVNARNQLSAWAEEYAGIKRGIEQEAYAANLEAMNNKVGQDTFVWPEFFKEQPAPEASPQASNSFGGGGVGSANFANTVPNLTKSRKLISEVLSNPDISEETKAIFRQQEARLNTLGAQLEAREADGIVDVALNASKKVLAGEALTSAERKALHQIVSPSPTGIMRPEEVLKLSTPEELVQVREGLRRDEYSFLDREISRNSFLDGTRAPGMIDAKTYNRMKARKEKLWNDRPQETFGPEKPSDYTYPRIGEFVGPRKLEQTLPENSVSKIEQEGEDFFNQLRQPKASEVAKEQKVEGEVIEAITEQPVPTPTQTLREGPATINELENAGLIEAADDVRATMAAELVGTEKTLTSLDDEIKTVRDEISRIEKRWSKVGSAEKETFRSNFSDLNSRLGQLLSNRAALEGLPVRQETNLGEPRTLESLNAAEKLRFSQLASVVDAGKERLLGRTLSDSERKATITELLNKPSAWNGRMFDYADRPLVPHGNAINAGYVETNYPELAQVMANLPLPHELKAQAFSIDTLVGIMQGGVDSVGLLHDPAKWTAYQKPLQQAFQLWDEVKDSLDYAKVGQPIKSFIRANCAQLGVTQKQAVNIGKAIQTHMPDLEVAFKFDEALNGRTQGLADYLTRSVTIGLNTTDIRVMMHELGHMHFMFGLGAEEKMAWLEQARRASVDEQLWTRAYPGYKEQMANLQQWQTSGEMSQGAIEAEKFRLESPAEMYASQFAAFTLDKVIPKVDQLSTMGQISESLRRVIGASTENFSRLPIDTQQFFLKVTALPDVKNITKIVGKELDNVLNDSKVFLDKDAALKYIQDYDEIFNAYASKFPMGTPIDEIVNTYPTKYLPDMLKRATYKLQYLDDTAAFEEMRAISQRVEGLFANDESIGSFVAASTNNILFPSPDRLRTNKDGNLLDVRSGATYNPEVLKSLGIQADASAWKEMPKELQDTVSSTAFLQIRDKLAKGAPVPDITEIRSVVDARRLASLRAAQMQISYAEAREYALGVMAQKGLVDLVREPIELRMARADEFSKLPQYVKDRGMKGIAIDGYCNLLRGAFFAYLGFEDDPNGMFSLPGLGKFNWNPKRYMDAPLAFALMPGFNQLRKGAWKGIKFGTKKGFDKLSTDMQRNVENIQDTVTNMTRWLGGPYGGLTREYGEMKSMAKNKAAMKARELVAFGDILHQTYSPAERKTISRLYDKGEGFLSKFEDRLKDTGKEDMVATVKIAHSLMRGLEGELRSLGLNIDKLPLPRFYSDVVNKKGNALIITEQNIKGIKFKGWEHQDASLSLKKRASKRFIEESVQAGGQQPAVGDKVNGYIYGNDLVYTVAGSPLDKMYSGYKKGHVWGNASEGYVITSMDNGRIKLSRNYTGKERQLRGEIEDMGIRFVNLANSLQKDYARANMYKSVFLSDGCISSKKVTNPYGRPGSGQKTGNTQSAIQYAKDNNNQWSYLSDGANKIFGTDEYGLLTDSYVSKDAAQALKAFDDSWILKSLMNRNEISANLVKGYRKALNIWKQTKTVMNPVSHMNNFVSNLIMGSLLGHNVIGELRDGQGLMRLLHQSRKVRELYRNGKVQEAKDLQSRVEAHPDYKIFRESEEAGLGDSSMWETELRGKNYIEEVLDEYQKMANGGQIQGDATGLLASTKSALKSGYKFMTSTYEAGDLVFKYGAFKRARQRGASLQDAVSHAYEAYFDYGTLSPGAKFLRDTGLVPFVSYMYKAIPALTKAMVERPTTFATACALLESINLFSLSMDYGAEDLLARTRETDNLRPEYLKGKAIGGLVRVFPQLPGNNIMDISRKFPMGDTLINRNDNNKADEGLATGFLKEILTSNPLISLAYDYVTGFDVGLGRSSRTGSMLKASEVADRHNREFWKRFANQVLPNWFFLPYTYSHDKFMNGLVAAGVLPKGFNDGTPGSKGYTGVDALGLPVSPASAFASLAGWGWRHVDPTETAKRNIQHTNSQLNIEKNLARRQIRSLQVAKEDKVKAAEDFAKILRYGQDRNKEYARNALNLERARRKVQGGTTLPH